MKKIEGRKLLPLHGLPQFSDSYIMMKKTVRNSMDSFNQGVVTINLVDVACSSDGDDGNLLENLR